MKTTFDIKQVPETKFGYDFKTVLIPAIQSLNCDSVLLVIDRYMRDAGLTSEIERAVFTSFPQSAIFVIDEKVLTLDVIRKLLGFLEQINYNVVVGYGGWRCIDLAKIAGISKTNANILGIICEKPEFLALRNGVPIISIPSTPPNGAEIDNKILFCDNAEKRLTTFEHAYCAPTLTIIDPKLMLTLPSDLTAVTGVDSLMHAIESLISLNASPISEILALQSIALIKENLLDGYKNGSNLRARYNIALGSYLAALSLNMTGSGIIHALAYPLTAHFGITHPQAASLVAPAIIKFNIPVVPSQFLRVARLLGCSVQGNDSEASKTSEALEALYRTLELPMQLSSYNISGNQIEMLARDAAAYKDCLERNPRQIEYTEILGIYRSFL